jgi:polyisoprenyl-teichoic acid--peptidoglycan teichoic acid transferase
MESSSNNDRKQFGGRSARGTGSGRRTGRQSQTGSTTANNIYTNPSYTSRPQNSSQRTDTSYSRQSDSYSQRTTSGYSRQADASSQRTTSGYSRQPDASSQRTSSAYSRQQSTSAQRTQPTKSTQTTTKQTAQTQTRKTAPKNTAQPKKKKHTGRKIFGVFIALLLVLTVGAGAAGVGVYSFVLQNYTSTTLAKNEYISDSELKSDSAVTNILLMSVDNENTSDNTRSDSMILLSIDTKHSKLKVTSFLRDMYITVPGHGETKLTHACAYSDGGPQLTCDTIELNFGVKIDAYAKIGYDVFRTVIDDVGGITIPEIDETESKALKKEGVEVEPGTNIHLNGWCALKYCRIRKGQTDFERTERQRRTISLVLQQMKTLSPKELIKLVKDVADKIECSIPKNELLSIGLKALPCLANDMEQTHIPTDGAWEYGTRDGMSVVLVNLEKNKEYLAEFVYEKD